MKTIFFTTIILIIIIATQTNGEILKCEGSIVNNLDDFEKRLTVYIDIVIPTDNAEEYFLFLADKESRQFKSLLQYNPIVRKTFIETTISHDRDGQKLKANRYEFIVTKMPDKDNSLVGFVYGYEPWILKVDTWKKNKPFIFFQTGFDDLIQGECK